MKTIPYTTPSGLQIGIFWRPTVRPPAMSADAELLQRRLLATQQSKKTTQRPRRLPKWAAFFL